MINKVTYRLKAKESIPIGIKRIATEQIAKAIDALSNTDDLGIDEAVHQARKRLKKNRAVVRLVRDRLGEDQYKQENARFRNLGRELACLRDSKVQIETLDHLVAHFSDIVTPETFTDLRRELRVDYRREYQRVIDEGVIISVKNELKDAKDAIANWNIESDDWSSVNKSLKRVYQRGYKGLDKALSEPTAENLHQWRKRVKYLRYQLKILSPMWMSLIKKWVDLTHDLSDYLGDDHDLAVLKEYVLNRSKRFDRDDTLKTLVSLTNRRRESLQSQAMLLGKRIYTEKPKRFVKRLGNYWQIRQAEIN